MTTTGRSRLTWGAGAVVMAISLWTVIAAATPAAPPEAVASPAAEMVPAATHTATAAKDAPGAAGGSAAQPAAERTSAEKTQGEKGAAPRKEMTEEEILKLPIFNRLNLDLEKGERLLEDVKDNTFGYDESAFYYLVQKALKNPDALKPPDEETVAYDTLMSMPSSYRGQAVTIEGVYMQCLPFSPPPLAIWKDAKTLYRVDLREAPMDEERPVATVIVVDDPMTYLHLYDGVRVKGYFYKVLQYKGSKGVGYAPMLVARRIEPVEAVGAVASGAVDPRIDKLTLGIAIGLLVLLGGAFFTARQLTRSRKNAGPKRQVLKFHIRRAGESGPGGFVGPDDKGGGPKP